MTARTSFGPHTAALASVLALVLLLASVTPAFAAVLDADYIGGTKVGDAPALRSKYPDLYIPSGVLSTMDWR